MNANDIIKLRRALKLSQDKFGKLIGVSKGTIVNYENGKVIPGSKQKMLYELLQSVDKENITIKGNNNITGNINGHNINISDPNAKKIIGDKKITIEYDRSAEMQRVKELENEISRLKEIISEKDSEIIASKNKIIELMSNSNRDISK